MLKGPDVSIEVSLKEHGIAWEIGETETRFYYGVSHNGLDYTGFDWADLKNNLDVKIEYNWAVFREVSEFTRLSLKDWEKLPLTWKIQDLVSYYGVQNIFGESYTKPMTYEEVTNEKESV